MNLKKKNESQKKRIASLIEKNELLRMQNENLRRKLDTLSDENEMYKYQMQTIEELRSKYIKGLEELRLAHDYYRQAIRDAHVMKSEYSKKFRELLRDIKRQT